MPGRAPGTPALSEEPSDFMIITTRANGTQKTVRHGELPRTAIPPLSMGARCNLDSPARRL